MFKGFEPKEGMLIQFLGVHALRWPWDSQVEPTIAFVEVDEWTIFERAIKLMTLAMEEIAPAARTGATEAGNHTAGR